MKKRIVFLLLCILITFQGCSHHSFKSYSEVYEQGTVEEQIEYVLQNDMFAEIDFSSFTRDDGSVGWERNDIENGVTTSYWIDETGEVEASIKGNFLSDEIEINIKNNRYEIWLRGSGFSYMCPLSSEDLSLLDSTEYSKDYSMIFEIKKVSIEDIKYYIDLYSKLTRKYLGDIYNLQ